MVLVVNVGTGVTGVSGDVARTGVSGVARVAGDEC